MKKDALALRVLSYRMFIKKVHVRCYKRFKSFGPIQLCNLEKSWLEWCKTAKKFLKKLYKLPGHFPLLNSHKKAII